MKVPGASSNVSPKVTAMKIALSDAGKRFNRDWIFRHLTYRFEKGNAYAITGPNGSGKSTLLQVLSGSMHFNEGSMRYEVGSQKSDPNGYREKSEKLEIPHDEIYNHVSICAPYLEVVEEMTLKEFLKELEMNTKKIKVMIEFLMSECVKNIQAFQRLTEYY